MRYDAKQRSIIIDAEKRALTLGITAQEMKKRKAAWKPMKPRYTCGVLAKYAHLVSPPPLGAVADANLKPSFAEHGIARNYISVNLSV